MAIGSTELSLLKFWFFILTIVELPSINTLLFQDEGSMDGFFSAVTNDRPGKRFKCLFLALLMLSRIQAGFYTLTPGVLVHVAAVHVLEAFAFGYEKLVNGDNSSNGIYVIVLFNALWFLSAAMRVDTH